MKIAMVHGRADPGRDGVADYTAHLVDALRTTGLDVEPVATDGTVLDLARAARRIARLRPDVVHVQFAPSAYGFRRGPGLLPALVGSPLVTTVHEYGSWTPPAGVPTAVWGVAERRGVGDRETGRLVIAAAATVATNAGHADLLRARLGTTARRVPLAPNVPDLGPVGRAAVRRELGVPPDAEVVAFFGFVHSVKGLRYLIDAVARLRRDGRERLHLLVLGGFTSLALPEPEARAFRAELTDRARHRGVAGHVTITGHLPAPAVSAALHAADVAAFPFTAGATTKSGALLSAFAHGLPTVVTAADPPDPELVDGDTAVVAPRVRDSDVLVDALRRVLDDPALRTRVAAGGARIAAARSWPRIAAAHRELYTGVVRG